MGVLRKYIKETKGNVAMMFSLTALLMVSAIGVAVDVSSLTRQTERYQDLADIAVLAAASSGEKTVGQLRQVANKAVASNEVDGETLTTSLTILDDNTLHVEVSGLRQSFFHGIVGRKRNMITAIAEAPPKGAGKLNLALVLDTTNSMSGSRIETLRSAATDLVDSLDSGSSSDEVMISVVPFAQYVMIPTSFGSEPWIQVHPTEEHCWDVVDEDASTGCAIDPNDESGDLVCSNTVYKQKCSTISWWGCMLSREDPWHKRDYYGGVKLIGLAPGGSCTNEMLPLTDDLDEVKSRIDSLDTDHETYIPAGLTWGWRALTPEAPLTEAASVSDTDRKSALLLMSDGENTKSYGGTNSDPNYPGIYHWQENPSESNSLTADLCASIKADDIIIYTVAFEVTDVDTIALLRNCASEPGKFFHAGDATALEAAFEDIGKDLASVRLSK